MFEKYSFAIIKFLRKDLDCLQMSKLMGYSYNQYNKFENGYKRFMLQDFFKACEVVKHIDVEKTFLDVLGIELTSRSTQEVIRNFTNLWGRPSEYMVNNYFDMSWSKWWRIYNGKMDISFEDFLKLIDHSSIRFRGFLEKLLHPKDFNKLFLESSQTVNFLKKYPESALILSGIFIPRYINAPKGDRDKTLSEIVGIPSEHCRFLVRKMIEEDVLYVQSNGVLKDHIHKINMRNDDEEPRKSLIDYTLKRALEENSTYSFADDNNHDTATTFKIAPIGAESKSKIKKELRESYLRIAKILDSQDPDDLEQVLIFSQFYLTT